MERICTACLSVDRKLYKLGDLQFFYNLLIPYTEFNLPDVQICWECRNTLRKCSQFQRIALTARDMLISYCLDPNSFDEQDLLSQSHSALHTSLQTTVDYNYIYTGLSEKTPSPSCIKQESDVDETYQETLNHVKLEGSIVTASPLPILPDNDVSSPLPSVTNDPLCEGPPKVVIHPEPPFVVQVKPNLKVVPSNQVPKQLVKQLQESSVLGSSKGVIKLTKLSPEQIGLLKGQKALKVKIGDTKPQKLVFVNPKQASKGKKTLVETLQRVKRAKLLKKVKKTAQPNEETAVPTTAEIYHSFLAALSAEYRKNFKVIVMSEEELAIRRQEMSREPQYVNSEYKCTDCIVGYYSAQQLQDHRIVKHTESDEQQRTRAYNTPSTRQCSVCRTYVPADRFAFHYGRHRVLYQCVLCDRVVADAAKVRAHSRGHESAVRTPAYGCGVCGKKLSTRHRLNIHKESHLTEQSHYTCEICGKGFTAKWSLENHVKRHSIKKEPVKCDVCNKEYKNRYSLASHIKNVHARAPGTTYRCGPCALDFVSEQCLNAHLRCSRAHADPAHFKHICHACGKGFMSERHLKDHDNYVHKGQTEYVCTYCNKMYSSAGGLRKHIKFVHEGGRYLKDKKCNVCGKSFTSPKTLREHQNIHNGTRPFKCPICGDTFKQSAALYTHRRLVHLGYKMRNKKVVRITDPPTADGYNTTPQINA